MASPSVTAVRERFGHGALVAAVLVTGMWHVAVVLPSSVFGWSFDRVTSVPGAAVWAGYMVIGIVVAMVSLRGGGRGPALPWVVIPTLLGGVATVTLTTSSTSFYDPYNWAFPTVGWFALVALWRRRLTELLAFFTANGILGLVLMTVALGETDQVSVGRYVMHVYGSSVIQITLFVGGRALAVIAGRTAQAQDDLARSATLRLAAEAVQRSRVRRYEMVQETVTHLLTELAADALDPTDPVTRRRLRGAVTRLRRLTVETDDVPDPLLQELRACADEAEKRGVEVDLQAPVGTVPPLAVEVRRALAEPAIEALAATSTWARVTIVAWPDEVVVAALADAHVDEPAWRPHEEVRSSYDREGDLLWVQARWSAPSRSRSSKIMMSS